MSTTQRQMAIGQPFGPESQHEGDRDSQQTQPRKDMADAQMDAYLSDPDSRSTDNTGIQRRTLECQALFELCQESPHLSGDDWIDKMSAEFNWWSLGIGAAKRGHSSLDYRVQTRDDVRNTLVNLLESLATSLSNYIDIASQCCDSLQPTAAPTQEQGLEESATHDSNTQPSSDDSPIGEQRYYIETTIRFLSQISTAIRKSGTKFRHQRVDKLLEARGPQLKEFGDYLRLLVLMSPRKVHGLHGVSLQHCLTGDPDWKNLWIMTKAYFTDIGRLTPVQNRLIKANLARRNRFDLYLARYHQKMQVQKESQLLCVQTETVTTSPPKEPHIPAPSQSHVSDTPSKRGEKTPIQPPVMEGFQWSSQSATKIGSLVMPQHPQEQKARSVSTKVSQGVLKQDYPKCPGAEGESFWCPYCAQLLDSSYSDSKKNKRWRGHVVEDLSPYVCVYEECDSPDAMYVTTLEWKKHIRERHSRAQWICDPCWLNSDSPEEFEFDSQEEWLKHTLTEHKDEVDECDLPDLSELSQRTGIPPIACPLCYEDVSLRNPETDKHLAEHLHYFALQAFPWQLIGCDDDEVTAFRNLVNTIRRRSSMILRKGHYNPATSISALLATIDGHLGRPSVRCHGYDSSFRPEILACLARLASIIQRHESQSPDSNEQESVDMWEEDLAQVFNYFRHLESLSELKSPAPSVLAEIQPVGDAAVSEASDKLRSDNARDPENRELGSRDRVRVDVPTSATRASQCGEQLGRLRLQFLGQDGTGREGSYYIPRHILEAFWNVSSIKAILRAYSINKSQEVILQSFLCTFSLLVYIGKVEFLGWLVERNLKDATFPLENRPPFWPDTPAFSKLFDAIIESQWIFFPVTFEQHELYNQVFCSRHIFPIYEEELIKASDSIQVHKIETNPPCEDSDPVTFVRKTYFESGKFQYDREVKTFTSLQSRSSPHIISYHGCYQQQRLDSPITYNLILGFVDGGNLEEFYTAMNPPHSLPDKTKIWNAFCGVLEGLHHLQLAAINTDFQIIHQDIKPDNLLVSKSAPDQPYDIELVITDFGYSHSQDTWGIDSHGGQVYGAPESSHHADYTRHGRTHITPKVDIWSLGCVMSEAAIWMKSGLPGLENYRNRRIAETRTLPRFDQTSHGGCFHDGAQALSAVRTAHDWIRNYFSHDIVTLQVLEMIDTSMLVPQGDRQDAQMLCERLAKIIQAASSGHSYNSPPSSSPPARSSTVRLPPVISSTVISTPARSSTLSSPPASSPPRLQNHPATLGFPWTPLARGRSQRGTTTNMTPASPQSPISTSKIEFSSPLSPGAELAGSQPLLTAPRLPVFNTTTPAPLPNIRRPSSSSPILTWEQARGWYEHAKNNRRPVDPGVEAVVRQLGNNVKGRDHIFFVDVSQSMGVHFHKIKDKFQILAYLAKKFDPDGVEVCFSSEVPLIHKGDTSKLLRKFNNQQWDQLSFEDRFGTLMDQVVIPRLSPRRQTLRLTTPKKLTIFVLTDGRWGTGREGAAGVENSIMRLIGVILKEGLGRTHVAIQFLRFGGDPDGKRYLTYLDQLGTQHNCDCVDTKSIDGNIFSMFMGPLNSDTDMADEYEL